MVFQLIYHSHFLPIGAGPSSTIRSILHASETNNFRNGITGFLIFDKSSFLQILEGDQAAVLETYDRIGEDPRHARVTVIAARQVAARAFTDWAMGGHLRSDETCDIYARHGAAGGLDPGRLQATEVVALAQDLLAFETRRQSQRIISAA
jgi:hypothetical protein